MSLIVLIDIHQCHFIVDLNYKLLVVTVYNISFTMKKLYR